MVVNPCNCSTWGLRQERGFPGVQGQPELSSQTLSQNKKKAMLKISYIQGLYRALITSYLRTHYDKVATMLDIAYHYASRNKEL